MSELLFSPSNFQSRYTCPRLIACQASKLLCKDEVLKASLTLHDLHKLALNVLLHERHIVSCEQNLNGLFKHLNQETFNSYSKLNRHIRLLLKLFTRVYTPVITRQL